MTPAEMQTMAAVATGWILDEVPDLLQDGLLRRVGQWRDHGHLPLGGLWHPIAETLSNCGFYDLELAACEMMISLEPLQPSFRLRLGRCLIRVRRPDEARLALDGLVGLAAIRSEALLLLLAELADSRAAVIDELEGLLLEDGGWGGLHKGFVKALLAHDMTARAEAFLTAWTGRWSIGAAQIMDMGEMAMLLGRPAQACALFEPLWQAGGEDQERMLGKFHGAVASYDDGAEARLLDRIDAAFRLPESELPRVALPDFGPDALGKRVVFLTFGDRALVNDFAVHYGETARLAGVDIHLYADSALTLPREFRGSDAEVERRIRAFEAEMARLRPDVLVVDCVSPLIMRGINPAMIFDLKRRLGFRVLCLMRDSHPYAMPLVRAWLPACDTLVADILSPIHAEETGAKTLPLVVPVQHGPFLQPSPQGDGLVFIGSVNFLARHALLSVLMTEDIRFRAIYGEARRHLAPDMASYARVLGEARGVLNISLHTPKDHLVTGRVWETLAVGSVLVEQDNPGTAAYLAPWRHYLPWGSLDDIVHLAKLMERHPDLAARIAAEGHAWALRHYHPRAVWGAMLGHAARPRPEADLDAEGAAAHDWAQVTFG
ncbi:hypothetical protein A6A04_05915 [Paramagnetospirillum marisnigri]|uniref:Spore protein YkvP/CgeB glycosyl transferase-like domain-containing protein n=1 Tax=Paramagnetospirillum marisnigri TaxID=1285242 RepID=A0A178MDP8_9PROT|nr:glycosyltransferase [Paramagnetospirillum marisnigri]OAN46646.1 hypothetical protein A6A04_05915 [Paramagnetospirillum marisnigri]